MGVLGLEWDDGSNRWIDGTVETLQNPVDRVTNPYDTVAGAADAAALQFDEGVGGLVSGAEGWYSLVDREPGNTAGTGDSSIWSTDPEEGAAPGSIRILLVVLFVGGVLWLVRPLLEIASEVAAG